MNIGRTDGSAAWVADAKIDSSPETTAPSGITGDWMLANYFWIDQYLPSTAAGRPLRISSHDFVWGWLDKQ